MCSIKYLNTGEKKTIIKMCWIVFAGVPAGRRAGGGGNSAAGKETAQHTLVELEFIHL